MEKMMHLASQYLAAAGISFVEKKDDDSHTNLGFSLEEGIMFTRGLDNLNTTLNLNYKTFALEWKHESSKTILNLNEKTHSEVLEWIQSMSNKSGFSKSYNYKFHYDLPYTITNDFTFELKDETRLKQLLAQRKLIQSILEDFLVENHLQSEIRVWPHHFDTGAFAYLPDNPEIGIGLGLAIPDEAHDDFYFYISGYQGHDSLDTSKFPILTYGKWHNEGFKGAILPINGISKTEGLLFFNEALSAYKNKS